MPKKTSDPLPLSRDRIVAAAMELAQSSGVDALSMRKVGQVLGVEAMSLYRHVDNKDDLLGGMVDAVTAQIAYDTGATDWKVGLRERALSAREVFKTYPWAAPLFESHRQMGPARLAYAEWALGLLFAADMTPAQAYQVLYTVDAFVYGAILQELHVPYDVDDDEDADEVAAMANAFAAAHPNLAQMAAFAATSGKAEMPGVDEFSVGLDLVLDGLQARLA